MKRLLLLPAALLAASPLAAQDQAPAVPAVPPLSLEQQMLLRCSAAFALVADRQQRGEGWARTYPPMGERGREFFVRATARLSDETGADVPLFEPLLRAEAESLLEGEQLRDIMPVCLSLLPPEPLPLPLPQPQD